MICPYCKNEISDTFSHCPSCGRYILYRGQTFAPKTKKKRGKTVLTILIGCLLLLLIALLLIIFLFKKPSAGKKHTAGTKIVRLEDCQITDSDEYKENEGDSFVDKIGKDKNNHGKVDVNGQTHEHGIEAWIARWNFTAEASWAYTTYDIGDSYKTLTGNVVLLDSYNTNDFNTTLYFFNADNGDLLDSYSLTPQSIPFDFSVNVEGVKQLKVYVEDNQAVAGGTAFGLIDTVLE